MSKRLTVLILLLLSCNKIEINPNSRDIRVIAKKELDLNNYFEQVSYQKFLIPDTLALGDITEYYELNNFFILVDRNIAKAVVIFNKEKKFINSIENIGNGPNEYLDISSISVDSINDILYLCDNYSSMRLQKYDFNISTSKPILILHYKFDIREIAFFNGFLYYYSTFIRSGSNTLNNVFLGKLDMSGKAIPLIERIEPERSFTRGLREFFVGKDYLYFMPSFTNIIYSISRKDSIKVAYRLMNSDFFPDYQSINFKKNPKTLFKDIKKYFVSTNQFFINDDFLYFSSGKDGYIYSGFKTTAGNDLIMAYHRTADMSLKNFNIGKPILSNLNKFIQFIDFEWFADPIEDMEKHGVKVDSLLKEFVANRDKQLVIAKYGFKDKNGF